MKPQEYDQWYDTPRGLWIGETEFTLLNELLAPRPRETLLDVGCGTGWFTRRFAERDGLQVTGLDPSEERLNYARSRARQINWLEGDACKLPFADGSFDTIVSVTALCFIADWPRALSEMVRVTRRRVVLGLLNHNSLLHLQKGRQGGSGAYRGAHWHTVSEVHTALASLPTRNVQVRSAIFLPPGSGFARTLEQVLPNRLLFGGFLAVSGDVER